MITNWTPLSVNEYNKIWDKFYAEFSFKPSVYPIDWPSIKTDKPTIKIDIADLWDNEYNEVKWSTLVKGGINSFTNISNPLEEIIVLDWQHECYYVNARQIAEDLMLPNSNLGIMTPSFIPEGDYYIFATKDFENIWFGHPWEKTITIIGDKLIKAFEQTRAYSSVKTLVTKKISYEILRALPTYGPMYIPISEKDEGYYSEGFVIRFYKSDGTDWVANFKPGWTNLREVRELHNSSNLLVIACGTCYIMNPDQTKPISVFGAGYIAAFRNPDKRLILHEGTRLTIIELTGEHWSSQQISWDGMEGIKLQGNSLTGLAFDPRRDEWIEFSFNIDDRKLTGGVTAVNRIKQDNTGRFENKYH